MIVERVFDKDRIYKILKDHEIFARIAEDGISIDEYEAPDNAVYLMDRDSTGLSIFEPRGIYNYEMHISILPNSRAMSMEFADSCINWLWNNTACMKISAQISEHTPEVIAFSLKHGFCCEGVNEDSFLKDGTIYSKLYMGLKRPSEV